MVTPQLLATSYMLHMIATVVWIGGIVFMALVVTPAIKGEPESARVFAAIRRRFAPLAGLSLAVLIVTGMVQLTSSTHYVGFLNLSNTWAKAVLLKHIAVGGMIATALYMSLVIQPDIRRMAMLLSAGKAKPAEMEALTRRQARAAQANMVLAIVVLLFTAIARAQ
jgi:putative copper resistance protein D